ncbi:hypothetical protein [Acinetobacter sp. NRRL B-65365]|uniref:hypothetical protein n=1 Tax=Acinetobacter sp. NRRL B-65365 TaxID=1785092 RepID=UPI000B267727|nr:hypothetical protein [Acinetobacter sp. NRRL B-65365]
MNTTKILGEAIGIQSQGTIDKTETQTNVGLTSAVIVGQFMRGRLDQLMVIHQGNIRGQLGYDPQNPFYNAVQDCLDTGVPSVKVLRVGEVNQSIPISCTGALNITDWIDINGDWGLEIEGIHISGPIPLLEIVDLLRANNFEVTVEEESFVPTPIIALNVDNNTAYRVSMNGNPLLNPATDISSFKNLGKYPNFTVDGTTSFDLYMAVVTASGGKVTTIGYQDSQAPPDHPLYTEEPILVVVTEDSEGFSFEFEAISGNTDITQNAVYEQKLISESTFPDEPLNGTIRRANNVVSCTVKAPALANNPYYAQLTLERNTNYNVAPSAYIIKDFNTGQEFTPTQIIQASPEAALYGFEIGVKVSELAITQTLYSLTNHTDQSKLMGIKVDPQNQDYLINGLSDQLTYDPSDNFWKGHIQPFPLDELNLEVIGARLTGNVTVFGRAYAPREKFPFKAMQLTMRYLNGAGQQDYSTAYMDGANNEQYISSETGIYQVEANYRGVEQNPFDVALHWGPLSPRTKVFNKTIAYTLDDWTIKTIVNGYTQYPEIMATIPDLPEFFASLYTHIGWDYQSDTSVDYHVSDKVQSLGNSAFANVPQCTSVTFFNNTPIEIGSNVFDNATNYPIYVPAVSVDNYKSAPGWSSYASRIFAIVE